MKRLALSRILSRVGLSRHWLRHRDRIYRQLTVLTYHRAGPLPSVAQLDEDVISTSEEEFGRQMRFCKENFNVVGIDDVLGFAQNEPIPRAPLLITFDDGYRDNFDVVLPVLVRNRIKAVFFIATSYVENRELFWWDRIHYFLKTSARTTLQLTYPRYEVLELRTPTQRAYAINRALRTVKDHYDLNLERYLAELARAADVEIDGLAERKLVQEHVMTWEQVLELRRKGMDVQSHTHTHRVVQTLPEHALVADLVGSRRLLEERVGGPIRALAYPVGRARIYADQIRETIRSAGYQLAFCNRSGLNSLPHFDTLDARRISIEPYFSETHFSTAMAFPLLA